MSVAFANEVVAGLRSYGVTVHFLTDWQYRGNGQTSDYRGGLMHHTATSYGMAPKVLWEGRPDLSPPLCNSAGNHDGSATIIAAHPANHAGASGGRSMGPLPVTGLFNKLVWGHEIVYPGDKSMTAGQYATMVILGRVITDILGRPNAEWIRAHGETSITGKWDPGYASGQMINMAAVRRDINNYIDPGEIDWEAKLQDGLWTPGGDKTARHAFAYIHQIQQRNANLSTNLQIVDAKLADIMQRVNELQTPDVDVSLLARTLMEMGLTAGLSSEEYKETIANTIRKSLEK